MDQAVIARAHLFDAEWPVDLLHATYVTHRFSRHAHEEYAVGVIRDGAVRTRLGHATVVVPAGHVIALNPGDVHSGEPVGSTGYRYRMFYLGAALLRAATASVTRSTSECLTMTFARAVVHDEALAERLTRAHVGILGADDRFTGEGLLVEALGDMMQRSRGVGALPGDEWPAARVTGVVRDYLEDEYRRVVSLGELSRITGVSAYHVSRLFRATTGVPPYAYLALVRVRRARELIARGVPLAMVSQEVGYFDQSHFTRQFKRVVGVPPGQYAAAVARPISRTCGGSCRAHKTVIPRSGSDEGSAGRSS